MSLSKNKSRAAVSRQLEKLSRSDVFRDSERLLDFLRFIVEETIGGRGPSLKEAVIGNAVYGRDPPYDPRIDSTVRVEARRLRRKLEEYYAGEGEADPVKISLPIGTYIPVFTEQTGDAGRASEKKAASGIFEKGTGAAIAIMPFRALTRAPDDENFADGLTDELAFALGRAPGLRIAARGITLQYKDKGYSPAQLATELKVDAVLHGTIRSDHETLRVTIEASDPAGFIVWSDRFDAPNTERLRLQEAISTTILSRVRFDSSHMRAAKIGPGPVALENNARIYRARQLLDQQTPATIREALALFKQVGQSAPDYARGHTGIADCYCDLFRLGLVDERVALQEARSAASHALAIDPESVEAHTALATIASWLDWNRQAAEAGFERALALGENARASRIYGVLLTIMERHNQAERLFREAREIEPFSAAQDVAEALSHYQSRRYHLLIDPKNEPWRRRQPPLEALVYTALSHIFGGTPEAAKAFLPDIEREQFKYPDLVFIGAEIEALLGKPDRAARLLAAGPDNASHFARASLAAALNDENQALSAIKAAIDNRELSRAWFRTDARFDRLRSSDTFLAQIERLAPLQDGAETRS